MTILIPAGTVRPGRLFSRMNHGNEKSTQSPERNAITTEIPQLLLAALALTFKAYKIPTHTAMKTIWKIATVYVAMLRYLLLVMPSALSYSSREISPTCKSSAFCRRAG